MKLSSMLQQSQIREGNILQQQLHGLENTTKLCKYLENLDILFRPLFHQEPGKIYNLNKCLELQRPVRKKKTEEETEILDFDEDDWKEELVKKKKGHMSERNRVAMSKRLVVTGEAEEPYLAGYVQGQTSSSSH